MSTFKYLGFKYKQGDSDTELITFCARADEIIHWGGVPAKNEQFHGGFQRALSARYKKIIDFFNSGQTSPGAIVVAFREGQLKINPMAPPTTWAVDTLTFRPSLVSVEFSTTDDENASLDTLRAAVLAMLEQRLKIGNGAEEDSADSVLQDDAEDVEEAPDAGLVDADSDEEELDVGHSKLQAFYQFLSAPEAVEAWLKKQGEKADELKKKGNLNAEQKQFLEFSAEERLKATLRSLVRPAMIVDGQHRVNGANESSKEDIVFTVCAVKDANWVEQVFQFVVLNKMAKPISKDFLTELLNTSLTNSEMSQIDAKLESVGIRNADRILHKYVNYDSRSPFEGMVAEAGEMIGFDREGKLSQQGMLTVAKRWRGVEKKNLELAMFMLVLGVNSQKLARIKWREHETWVPFFFAFWRTLRDMYESQQVWVKAGSFHLLYIVTLQALQDVFLESKAEGGVKFSSMDDFRAQVKEFFDPVPGAFFQGWSATGLQSGSGWEDIKEAVRMFRKGQRLATVKANSPLFKQ